MALTEPDFIERDADTITAEMIAKYEADTGKTLYPAQAERSGLRYRRQQSRIWSPLPVSR